MINPPAFPSHGSMGEVVQEGMSLRDYFAGQALIGVIIRRSFITSKGKDIETQGELAEIAFEIADKMLAKREKSL